MLRGIRNELLVNWIGTLATRLCSLFTTATLFCSTLHRWEWVAETCSMIRYTVRNICIHLSFRRNWPLAISLYQPLALICHWCFCPSSRSLTRGDRIILHRIYCGLSTRTHKKSLCLIRCLFQLECHICISRAKLVCLTEIMYCLTE